MLLSNHSVSDKTNIKPADCKIGFLGLGAMGLPMVRNLVKYGHHVTIWNRNLGKVGCLLPVLQPGQAVEQRLRCTALRSYTMTVIIRQLAELRSILL